MRLYYYCFKGDLSPSKEFYLLDTGGWGTRSWRGHPDTGLAPPIIMLQRWDTNPFHTSYPLRPRRVSRSPLAILIHHFLCWFWKICIEINSPSSCFCNDSQDILSCKKCALCFNCARRDRSSWRWWIASLVSRSSDLHYPPTRGTTTQHPHPHP